MTLSSLPGCTLVGCSPPPFLLTLPSISSFLPYALARVRVT